MPDPGVRGNHGVPDRRSLAPCSAICHHDRRVRTALIVLVAVAGVVPAPAASLSELLQAISAAERFPEPTRADVRIEYTQDDKTMPPGAAVFVGRGHTLYVETRDGTRALVRPSKILVPRGRHAVRATPGARLGTTGVLLEDLVPVTPWMLNFPQVSDEGPTGTVVTGAPAFPSVRALIVLTIQPEDRVVSRAKFFEKSITDLATFWRNEELVDVGGRPRPTRITVERPREFATTRLQLAWRAAPEAARTLSTPAGLRAPSPITW